MGKYIDKTIGKLVGINGSLKTEILKRGILNDEYKLLFWDVELAC